MRADSSSHEESAPSDVPGDGGTSDWRGPESAGRMPADIEATPPAEPVVRDEPASSANSASTDPPTSFWRGPEATGWSPDEIPATSPEQRASEPTHEWPAADLRRATRGEHERLEEAEVVDGEPPRRGRAPAFSFFSRARSDDRGPEEDADDAAYAPSEHVRVEERPRRLPGRRAASAVIVRADPAEICPFLVAASGGWRLAVPSREHRCGAVNPPSALSPQKQTRLCLTEGHLRCATFLAAAAARESRVGSAAMPERVSRWALARTTPVVEEVGGVRTTLAGMLADRRRWPAIPAMLLVVALATLGLSSLRGGGAVTALASPSPQPTTAAVPTVSIAPTPSVEPTPEPSATAAPTAPPTAAPTPAPTHATYTVVSGDTLGAIAKQFGTTVQALMDLNGITDPGKLKIGQVLQIP
jgi:LysM repeat protein